MGSYRKKPVVIEAREFNGTEESVAYFMPMDLFEYRKYDRVNSNHYPPTLVINTLEGNVTAQVGDYIIKGVNGEFYPCKPDIFAKTYDLVEPVDTQGGDAYRETMYNGWLAKQEADNKCTAPQDPDHELTEDEVATLASGGSLCDCCNFVDSDGSKHPVKKGDLIDFGSARRACHA